MHPFIYASHRSSVPGTIKRRSRAALGRALGIASVGLSTALFWVGQAYAAVGDGGTGPSAPSGGLGAQMNMMSNEAADAGSTAFSMACYIAAAACFFFGVWAAWQSRQPQNRETGYVGRAAAGLVLCGLFASAGVWINKASISASGGSATISGTPGMVTFGAASTNG